MRFGQFSKINRFHPIDEAKSRVKMRASPQGVYQN